MPTSQWRGQPQRVHLAFRRYIKLAFRSVAYDLVKSLVAIVLVAIMIIVSYKFERKLLGLICESALDYRLAISYPNLLPYNVKKRSKHGEALVCFEI